MRPGHVSGLLVVRLVGGGQRLLQGGQNQSQVLESVAWICLILSVIRVCDYLMCGEETEIVCALIRFDQHEDAVIENWMKTETMIGVSCVYMSTCAFCAIYLLHSR
jgi:hypothetical protein